ncbi:MAG: hypothetical protein WBA22_06715 [Candidatus Methanofastidiosia archaeon]
MPKTRPDIEGEKLRIEEKRVPARIINNQRISTLELYGVSHIFLSGFIRILKSFMDERLKKVTEMQWHLTLVPNGGARILRAIASWIEFHLSPSYVLFNLKALSTVTGRLLFVDGSCSLDNLFRW